MGDPVQVGQTWTDVDKRRLGRTLRVVQIMGPKAICANTITGKRADIKLSRFSSHGGFRKVKDGVPAATAPSAPPVSGGIV
jgi:hypothetical protein